MKMTHRGIADFFQALVFSPRHLRQCFVSDGEFVEVTHWHSSVGADAQHYRKREVFATRPGWPKRCAGDQRPKEVQNMLNRLRGALLAACLAVPFAAAPDAKAAD